ncbi:MAG TPA: glycoside hydrolase family 3 N-terminal domain-containing protein [Steroidobacteraceae bacterium]|nr:glycoside hydrolase family 3 N-terminal domain-containing protein [Steroidobacteraceae bacterium]
MLSPEFDTRRKKMEAEMMRRLCATATLSVLLVCHALDAHSGEPTSAIDAGTGIYDPSLDARVETLLSQMTLEEKVGQLAQFSAGQPTGPGTGRTDYEDMIAKGQIGALFNLSTAKKINRYQRIAVNKSRLKIPLVFGLDVIHGFRTVFPVPLALASTWDPRLVEQTARVAAVESSAAGIRWTFSPMIDIARDARWGRMTEGAGEDPFLGSQMAAAYVRGYQGTRLDAPDSIAACAKHFVGYGAAEAGRDYNTTEISEHTLRQIYLPPFRAAVDAGAATLMTAFNSLNGVPASANPFTLRQVLRKEWGFRGVVDSDWESLRELIQHGIANDRATAALKGFMGGVDMDMASSVYHDHLVQLVRAGQVPQERIDESVRNVLRLKFALGLFERPYTDEAREAEAMLRPESVSLAQTAAERSFVLLKNSPGPNNAPLLPLADRVQRIALIGPLADDLPSALGPWAGLGRNEDVMSFHAALAKRVGERNLIHLKGVGVTGGSDKDLATAVAAAGTADVVILTLGESGGEMTGEATSRAFIGLPGRQQELLEKIVATGKPVVLILFSGRPLTLPWAFEHVPAVLAAWLPGIQAGPALVRTLYGESNPTGKLVVSWPRSVGQEPLYYNALNTGRPANKKDLTNPPGDDDDTYVSRYLDERNDPQFPFGYGLSYTTFRYGSTEIGGDQLKASELTTDLHDRADRTALTVSADVTNTGSRAGEEIVQLYVRLIGTSVSQPVRALKGFQRVALAPGETKKVTFALAPEAFALWNDRNEWVVEPAKTAVWISPDSARGSPVTLQIQP